MSNIVISVPEQGTQKSYSLPHVPGKRLQQYLQDLKGERGRGLMGLRERCRIVNARGEPLRMAYVPQPGEVITFRMIAAALS